MNSAKLQRMNEWIDTIVSSNPYRSKVKISLSTDERDSDDKYNWQKIGRQWQNNFIKEARALYALTDM